MAKVIWAPSAIEDVNSIAEYIGRDSIARADLFVRRIFEATDRLEAFPKSGRVIPEIGNQACREIIYSTYRIMYKIVGNDVWITGVIHGSRNWDQKS